MERQVGQTKEVGFQFGIRKTIPLSAEIVWNFLLSAKGLETWLGKLKSGLEFKKEYETENGTTGFVRVLKPNSHIRLNWKLKDWPNMSTVQLRVIEKQEKTTIAIHQEKLLNSEQRSQMKEYWTKIIEKINTEIKKSLQVTKAMGQ